MASKVRHLCERNGRYFARLVVPEELRPVVGKTEIRTALGADRREAIRTLSRAVVALQDRLAQARREAQRQGLTTRGSPSRPMPLSAIAHLRYTEGLAFDDEVRNQGPLGSFGFPDENYTALLKRATTGSLNDDDLNTATGWIVEKFRERGNHTATFGTPEWRELARMLAGVQLEVISRTMERDEGDFNGKPSLSILTTPAPIDEQVEEVSLTGLLDSYLAELKKAQRGHSVAKGWPPVIRRLTEFLRHDDAAKVTRTDLIKWRDDALEKVSPSTFQNSWLACVRATLQSGIDAGLLKDNPAVGLKVRAGRQLVLRDKGFSDQEVRTILCGVLAHKPAAHETAHASARKKWIAWICALTGARVGEIMQLRREDIRQDGGIDFLRLTPEAGTIKTGKYRDGPLHRQLIELGFMDFVKTASDGPLFYKIGRAGDARTSVTTASSNLGKWIRTLGVSDKDVSPNHAWRHRFKTIGRQLEISARTLDDLQGHAPRTAGEAYGSVSLSTKAAAIAKFPRIEIDAGR
jgi:integrase